MIGDADYVGANDEESCDEFTATIMTMMKTIMLMTILMIRSLVMR